MQKDALPRLQLRFELQVQPGGREHLDHSRRRGHLEALGQRQGVRRGAAHHLGVASASQQRDDRVSDSPIGDPLANGLDHTGAFEPEDLGRPGRRVVATRPLHEIGPVHRRRLDADAHLTRLGLGRGHLGPLQGVLALVSDNDRRR